MSLQVPTCDDATSEASAPHSSGFLGLFLAWNTDVVHLVVRSSCCIVRIAMFNLRIAKFGIFGNSTKYQKRVLTDP